MNSKVKVRDILLWLEEQKYGYSFHGDKDAYIDGYCPLKQISNNKITWISHVISDELTLLRDKGLLVVADFEQCNIPEGINIINCINPKEIYFALLTFFYTENRTANIAEDATILTKRIGENVSIGHNCFIGSDVVINDNVVLGNNVSIECPAIIGENSIIHSGTVLGTDGFGYYTDRNQKYQKVPHFGGILIGSNVEIGANVCIDRGTMEDTVIEDGCKIDNLCHIAHNVKIGEDSLVIALSLIGGSTELGKRAYIAPGCTIKNKLYIGENSFVGMGAVVIKNVEKNMVVAGVPAKAIREK